MKYEEIRNEVIMQYLSGGVSYRSLAARYNIGSTRIHRWILADKKQKEKEAIFNTCVVTPLPPLGSMSSDVAFLREELRIAQIRILLLEATIDISDEQYGTSIRKKAGPRQS